MMFVYLFMLGTALAYPQMTIKPDVLIDIFGTPPSTVSKPPGLEDITVKPTDSTSIFSNNNGEACKCVPYYLCDTELNGVDVYNSSVTGAFQLDIRFGQECQESVERCCKYPKEPTPPPKPNANNLKGCGYRNRNGIDFTVTGGSGSEAQYGEFPWVVAILDAKNDSYVGVGVLIHPQVVLTGAHIPFRYAGALKIRAGEWDTQTNKERLPSQERIVRDLYIHPEFDPKSLKNDIGLLHLKEPVDLADHINVICLPSQNENFDRSQNCVANGWGKNVFGLKGRYAVILKRVELNMVEHQKCNNLLGGTRLGHNFKLHESFVCAGGEEGKDTCQGDGGAPLACPIGNDRYKLSGLVAWGVGCGVKGVPAVYVNVAMFRNLINAKMAEWGYDTKGNDV